VAHGLHEALLAILAARTAQDLCGALCSTLSGHTTVLVRVWLIEPDGSFRLTGSAGAPTGGGSYSRLDGSFGRIHAGQGKIGRIAETGTPMVVRGLRGDEPWLVNPGWSARQGVRAFVGYPLLLDGETVLGVLAMFERAVPSDSTLQALGFVAQAAALRLIDLRERAELHARLLAFEEALSPAEPAGQALSVPGAPTPVVTRAELRQFERQTIESALAQTNGRIFGPHGAAALLAMKPTTLASRIKALGIR
jgi:transcriptional regulator with GAF, ATPase, and Fis domain